MSEQRRKIADRGNTGGNLGRGGSNTVGRSGSTAGRGGSNTAGRSGSTAGRVGSNSAGRSGSVTGRNGSNPVGRSSGTGRDGNSAGRNGSSTGRNGNNAGRKDSSIDKNSGTGRKRRRKRSEGTGTGKRRNRKRSVKITLQILTLSVLLVIFGAMLYFYARYGKTIFGLQADAKRKVRASTEETFRAAQTSLVYDVNGNLISTLKAEKDVYYVEYSGIPKMAVEAMIVSEDRKFFEHNGVDYLANIRAAIKLIEHKGEITQGASTITQQLARNVFLTHKVTYERKIEEIFVAQELEKRYSKIDIMEFYMNGIYFANGHYGIQAAALGYFGEGADSLSLSQIAFLCAIPNNPNLYNPLTNMDNTLERRDRILLQLYEAQRITEEQYREAKKEKIVLNRVSISRNNYVETYVYYCAIRALMKENGFVFRYEFESEEEQEAYEDEYYELYYRYQKELYVQGYRIYTSIDLEKQELLQQSLDEALKDFTEVNDEGIYQMQGAAVCIDNDSGRVAAIVGGRDQETGGYTLNRGYQSFRQPGSAIKPLIVYTPAFERGYTPESIVVDKKEEDGPKNSDKKYLGEIKLQKAIELSKNTIAWKLFEELTPVVGLSYLHQMHFAKISRTDYVPAASLGGLTVGVSPVEMAAAYAALENDGYYREPTCIIRITDAQKEEIVGDAMESIPVYQKNASRIMTEALTGVMKKGTAKGLGLSHTVSAGKTGTTNDRRDGWFVGYTPYYTTSVWVGYDMPKTVDDLKGASYPGTIWHNFMEQLHDSAMTGEFQQYDWRAALEQKREEEERALEEEWEEPEEDNTDAEADAGEEPQDDPEGDTEDTTEDSWDSTEEESEVDPDQDVEEGSEENSSDEDTDGAADEDPEESPDGDQEDNQREDTEITTDGDNSNNSAEGAPDGDTEDNPAGTWEDGMNEDMGDNP